MSIVRTEGLSKTYRSLRGKFVDALAALDLSVERGDIFGLLGPNGAGKTTLVKLLLGIVHPTQGRAWLFDRPTTDPTARRPVGYLPENHRFPPFLTGRQVLDLYSRMGGVDGADAKTQGDALLDRVKLAEWANTPVRKYSKGMMQRLGLAQALMGRPNLLFLDEPTDGVDPVGRREIRDLLLALRDDGVTVFLNSHLLGEVEQVCSRVAILNGGRLVHEGSVDALTSRERIWEVRCTSIPRNLLGELDGRLTLAHELSQDTGSLHRYHLVADDRAELNATLDRLRAHDVEIDSLTPLRQSLEDAFVQVIGLSSAEAPA